MYEKKSSLDVTGISEGLMIWTCCKFRSSLSQLFFKIGALKKLHNIHEKTPVMESYLNKVSGLQAYNFIKKRLQHRRFPATIAKFLRTAFFREHFRWLLLLIATFFRKCAWWMFLTLYSNSVFYWDQQVYNKFLEIPWKFTQNSFLTHAFSQRL